MEETNEQRVWREEAHALAQIGAVLAQADLPTITVRLPAELARAAVAAWEREDEGELEAESFEQRVIRHRAGSFALIGLAVQERGRADGDDIVVDLSPDVIGSALDAADDLPA
jgi:hypothetical protein